MEPDPELSIVVIVLFASGLFCGAGLVTEVLAARKGYRPWFWIAALGPVGLIVMMLKPNLTSAATPEEREAMEQLADWTGGILSGVMFFLGVGMPVFNVMTFVQFQGVLLAPPALAPAPVMPTVESSDSSPDRTIRDEVNEDRDEAAENSRGRLTE
jgi:hypothetical protein